MKVERQSYPEAKIDLLTLARRCTPHTSGQKR